MRDEGTGGAEAESVTQSNPKITRSGCRDKVLLLGAALLVCVIGGGAFLLGEIYHINPAWLFFAWNSILLIPIIGTDFRNQLKKPAFVIFFAAWMAVHGLVVIALMKWVPIALWIPSIGIEFFVGYFVAHYAFHSEPD